MPLNPYDKNLTDPGIFDYEDDGFTFYGRHVFIRWREITALFGYKRDDFTTDCICMDLFSEPGFHFSIDEDTKGWYLFQSKLAVRLPRTAGWEARIAQPPFAAMHTLIYDRDNRSDAEAYATCYPK